jgi:tRNA dimethylallyltransferase
MQMYKGLPIITNKISTAERQNIPHHILDQIGLEEQPWTVSNFRREAHKNIREIRSRGRLPILVGGTHYYTEAVLFNGHLLGGKDAVCEREARDTGQEFPILDAPTSEILAKLREVDPKIANRWHPDDRRKIRRSLEIWLQTGKTASQTYEEQSQQRLNLRTRDQVSSDPTSTASHSSIIFWLRAKDDILKKRLDDRVDSMLSSGLMQDAQDIAKYEHDLNAAGATVDKTKGIWASIGYKELEPYLSALHHDRPRNDQPELDQIKTSCIDAIKSATRQYARRQDRWIRTHFADALTEAAAMDTLYPLDCTHLEDWNTNVQAPTIDIVEHFLAGNNTRPTPESVSEMAREILSRIRADLEDSSTRECRYCEICDKTMMTEKEWTGHIKSNTHRKAVAGRRKWEAFQAWKDRQAEVQG